MRIACAGQRQMKAIEGDARSDASRLSIRFGGSPVSFAGRVTKVLGARAPVGGDETRLVHVDGIGGAPIAALRAADYDSGGARLARRP